MEGFSGEKALNVAVAPAHQEFAAIRQIAQGDFASAKGEDLLIAKANEFAGIGDEIRMDIDAIIVRPLA